MLIIGIAGGTGSGKTTVVRKILERLPQGEVVILPQDSYYKDSSHLPLEDRLEINFDHPDSLEWELLIKHLKELKKGHDIDQPIYSYLTCTRASETIPVKPTDVIIVEGILILYNAELRKLLDLKVFVDADADVRLARRVLRDTEKRGRTVRSVVEQWQNTVKPMHEKYVEPSKKNADIIVPQGGKNPVALDLIVGRIQRHLDENA